MKEANRITCSGNAHIVSSSLGTDLPGGGFFYMDEQHSRKIY